MNRKMVAGGVLLLLVALSLSACSQERENPRILVFSRTEGFRHGPIEDGVSAIDEMASRHGWIVDATEDASAFEEENLQRYRAVVFLNTSGDVLDHYQQADFERFIQSGGGFAGVYSAADTERDWPWYGQLVGAYFTEPVDDPPAPRPAVLQVVGENHPAVDSIDGSWRRTDLWYGYQRVNSGVNVLLSIDAGGDRQHPVAWYHEFDGGRAFYTGAAGHTPDAFSDPDFLKHLEGGLQYVVGDGAPLDYDRAETTRLPEENRFTSTVLADHLDEPTELAVLPDGRVLFVERKGAVKLYDPAREGVRTINQLDVHTEFEDGLMGIGLDPGFENNGWVYLYYAPTGADPQQHLSRFEFTGDSLDLASEVVVLVVRTQRDECCHTGGSIDFDAQGNLYLSTGDDTNPFQSDGYAPIDDRPGRSPFDARTTSANTNDLRGKILRIRPQEDGSYTIPPGNLFPEGDATARPEIFVMGNRNPYRIAVDRKTGYLYWGEIGPDAGNDDAGRGPRGYDEVNQAREAGFFGWPLFIADNKPYRRFDFDRRTPGAAFDPSAPVNESPNNTGKRELPPARTAFIWYPYADSPEFPLVGTGGRSAMAGPVFYSDEYDAGDYTFPDYYNGKLFIYEWMRGWIMAVTMGDGGDLVGMEPFMPATRFSNPMDMAFDRNGVMYLLEYGTGWFKQNPDARLLRVEYNRGNRRPVVEIAADRNFGAAPMTVRLSSEGTRDFDGDELTYEWSVAEIGGLRSGDPHPTFTFEQPGTYTPTLTVTDDAGNRVTRSLEVKVGNEPPEITLDITGNRSFYWDDGRIGYDVRVQDAEDGVPASGVLVQVDFLEQGYDQTLIAQGHQVSQTPPVFSEGRRLIDGSDCSACHGLDTPSIGPSFMRISERYTDDPAALNYLSDKIIEGGGGVWGEQVMAAHPQLSKEDATKMVEYILTLTKEEEARGLPASGTYATDLHRPGSDEGAYIVRAAYTDRGAGGVAPLTSQEVVVLRNPRVEAEAFDEGRIVRRMVGYGDDPTYVRNVFDGANIVFRELDLTEVSQITYRVVSAPLNDAGGTIELRLDAVDGPLVSTADVPGVDGEVSATVEPTAGVHDLYFVFRSDERSGSAMFLLDWIQFSQE